MCYTNLTKFRFCIVIIPCQCHELQKHPHLTHSLPDEQEMGEDGLLLCYDLLHDASFCNTSTSSFENILHVSKDHINC